MEVGKINENKIAVLKQAIEKGKATKEATSLFNALNFENTNPISDNDFSAFNIFKDKNGELSLNNEKLKALKLFDINNDDTFSDIELNLLEITRNIGGESLVLGANSVDFNKNGKLNKEEIDVLAKLLKNHIKQKNKQTKTENKILNSYGSTPLQKVKDNFEKTKKILDKIGDDKELLEKFLLTKDEKGNTPLHLSNAQITKEILNRIGNDIKLFEKVLLVQNNKGNTPLHSTNSRAVREMLEKTGDDKELLEKVLFIRNNENKTFFYNISDKNAKLIFEKIGDDKKLFEKVLLDNDNKSGNPFHTVNVKTRKVILEKIKDDKNLLEKVLLSKSDFGFTPLHYLDSKTKELILDAVGEDKELLKKILFARDKMGGTPLHCGEVQPILDKIGDDEELLAKLLFAKDNIENTPLHVANKRDIKAIFDKINGMKNKDEAKLLKDRLKTETNRLGQTFTKCIELRIKKLGFFRFN